jgi:ribosomal-protein-alanine N-acetyltransferase
MEMTIRPLSTLRKAQECAQLMSSSEPWITLRRGYEASLQILANEERERYVAYVGEQLAGFLILNLRGAFVGYIQVVCVAPGFRGRGLGSRLIAFAEERIFREYANVFMCVSSFNASARRLYERLGYVVVGELKDYIVAGYSEILLRKTRGPLSGDNHAASKTDGT